MLYTYLYGPESYFAYRRSYKFLSFVLGVIISLFIHGTFNEFTIFSPTAGQTKIIVKNAV
jgi:hypothetical protein